MSGGMEFQVLIPENSKKEVPKLVRLKERFSLRLSGSLLLRLILLLEKISSMHMGNLWWSIFQMNLI